MKTSKRQNVQTSKRPNSDFWIFRLLDFSTRPLCVMAGLFAAASFTALGQVPADAPRPEKGAAELPPEPAQPDASKHDVYINDSFEAADAVAKGRAFAGRGRWREAAALLQ